MILPLDHYCIKTKTLAVQFLLFWILFFNHQQWQEMEQDTLSLCVLTVHCSLIRHQFWKQLERSEYYPLPNTALYTRGVNTCARIKHKTSQTTRWVLCVRMKSYSLSSLDGVNIGTGCFDWKYNNRKTVQDFGDFVTRWKMTKK